MNFTRLTLSFMVFLIAVSGCGPAKPYSEPGPDYYADLERSNVDGRWYHKNPPNARGMMSHDSPRNED